MVQASSRESFTRNPQNRSQTESEMSRQVVEQTTRIPTGGYIGLALGSMIASALLAIFAPRKEFANFVGLWAPSFLLFGIINRLQRLEDSQSYSSQKRAA